LQALDGVSEVLWSVDSGDFAMVDDGGSVSGLRSKLLSEANISDSLLRCYEWLKTPSRHFGSIL